MKYTHIRNATGILHIGTRHIMIDPMLCAPKTLRAMKFVGPGARRNPLVPLPEHTPEALVQVTDVLLSHAHHIDHLDEEAVAWIVAQDLPVWASDIDLPGLQKRGLNARNACGLSTHGIHTEVLGAWHGRGIFGWLMGPGSGFYLRAGDGPGVYLTGDTVLTPEVIDYIKRLHPALIIAPAGVANFGIGPDILFDEEELIQLAKLAPGHVLFNHMEALDHCRMTRARLGDLIQDAGVASQVSMPEDGVSVEFELDSPLHTHSSIKAPVHSTLQKWVATRIGQL